MTGYRQFYGLSGSAFGKTVSLEHLLVYPQLTELQTEFEELLVDGGIGIFTGEMGIGKTTSLRYLLGKMELRSCQVAYHGSSRHSTAVLAGLVEALGVAPALVRATLLRQLGLLISRTWREQRKKTLLAIDDAQLIEDGLLEDLRLLTNFELDTADPLILILVGHPTLRLRLGKPVHLALLDRVRLHYRLEGLSKKETADYVDHHIQQAGAKTEIFNADAKAALFEHAQGIPRRINRLGLAALKKAAARKLKTIDAELIGIVNGFLAQSEKGELHA
jgi:type II secretory pathway predicted ATPase ExeA